MARWWWWWWWLLECRYFKPKSLSILTQWGEAEDAALLRAVEEYGVGEWKEIAKKVPSLAKFVRTRSAQGSWCGCCGSLLAR